MTIDQIKHDQDVQTLALQGLQREFAAYKEVATQTNEGVAKILSILGHETEDGNGGYSATGLLGRVRRNEGSITKLNRLYRRWIAWGAGFSAASVVFVAVLWYVLTHPFPKFTP